MINQSNLDSILDKVILSEGSQYTNNPNDKGGPTKYGITLNALKLVNGYRKATAETVKNLELSVARSIYKNMYASPFLFIDDKLIFQFIFNASIQHGVKTAAKMLQKSVGFTGKDVDGIIGNKTITAVNAALIDQQQLLSKLVAIRCQYYADILSKNKSQLIFAAGWFNRVAKDLL